jgi:Fe-S-cluster containining protein
MKRALRMSSSDFLERYTFTVIGDKGLPVVILKMLPDEHKSCPFVDSGGCRIYGARPWACRIYPLRPESTAETERSGKRYYSVMDVPFCRGLRSGQTHVLSEWLENQGVPEYHEMEIPFKKIVGNPRLAKTTITNTKIQQMFYMACYDLDRFRKFILESSFLKRFAVSPGEVDRLKNDDTALYGFAFRWLEYGLLSQQVLKVKPEFAASFQKARTASNHR